MVSYFDPTQGQQPQQAPQQAPDLTALMSDPRTLGALLAFGTQAMTPTWGGGMAGLGQAIGAAGETASAQGASLQKQQEIDSKSQLREAQAGAAEARANTAGTRASLTGEIERGKTQRANDLSRIRLTNMHNNYLRGLAAENANIRKTNSDPLRPPGTPPIPEKTALPLEEWIRGNPMLQSMGLIPPAGATPPAGSEDDGTLPPGATQDVGSTAQAPTDPKARLVGQVYLTPKGPLKWVGNGWSNP